MAALQQMVSESRGLAGESSFAILLDEYGLRLAHDRTPELVFKSVMPLDEAQRLELQADRRLPNLPQMEMSTDQLAFAEGLANAHEEPFFAANDPVGDYLEQMAVI